MPAEALQAAESSMPRAAVWAGPGAENGSPRSVIGRWRGEVESAGSGPTGRPTGATARSSTRTHTHIQTHAYTSWDSRQHGS